MRIAHLARTCYPFHPYGGLERHVYSLTLELARLGHEVELYTQPPTVLHQTINDPAWQQHVHSHYIPYATTTRLRRNSIPDRLINYPLFSQRLGGAVRRAKPQVDIVHAHGLAGWGYTGHTLPGVPLVLNPHGMEEFKNRARLKQAAYAPFRYLLLQTAKRAQAVIATDAALVPEVTRYLKVAPAKVNLIPNAIALDEIDQLTKAGGNLSPYGIAEADFILLSVGRLEANKGFEVMLHALAEAQNFLTERYPHWQWLVVGTGQEADRLKALTEKSGLAQHVKFLGSVETSELHALYERADLFVHPTLYEGSSLVTLEALAHGRPVLASATGGIPDKVFASGDLENGRLAPPGNAAELAAGLHELVSLPRAELQRLGHNGRLLIETRFSWTAAARQTVSLYEALLKQQRHR